MTSTVARERQASFWGIIVGLRVKKIHSVDRAENWGGETPAEFGDVGGTLTLQTLVYVC